LEYANKKFLKGALLHKHNIGLVKVDVVRNISLSFKFSLL